MGETENVLLIQHADTVSEFGMIIVLCAAVFALYFAFTILLIELKKRRLKIILEMIEADHRNLLRDKKRAEREAAGRVRRPQTVFDDDDFE